MKFTNAEICAVLKFSTITDRSARETFHGIRSIMADAILSLPTLEEWLQRFRVGESGAMDSTVGRRPLTAKTEQIIEHIELDRQRASRNNA